MQVISLLKGNLQIKREMTVSAASRVMTGPEVLGCRPVLATFQEWKDRDEVLRKAGVFKGNNIHVTEDMSRLVNIFFFKIFLMNPVCPGGCGKVGESCGSSCGR